MVGNFIIGQRRKVLPPSKTESYYLNLFVSCGKSMKSILVFATGNL